MFTHTHRENCIKYILHQSQNLAISTCDRSRDSDQGEKNIVNYVSSEKREEGNDIPSLVQSSESSRICCLGRVGFTWQFLYSWRRSESVNDWISVWTRECVCFFPKSLSAGDKKRRIGIGTLARTRCVLLGVLRRGAENCRSRATDTKVGHSAKGVSPRAMTTVKLETTSDLASGHFPTIDPRSVTTKLPCVRLKMSCMHNAAGLFHIAQLRGKSSWFLFILVFYPHFCPHQEENLRSSCAVRTFDLSSIANREVVRFDSRLR